MPRKTICLLIVALSASSAVQAEEVSSIASSSAAAIQADPWEQASRPGPNHQKFEELIGGWNVVLKSFGGNGQAVREVQGQAERKWILGGRFVHEEFDVHDAKSHLNGLRLLGYDNTAKTYNAVWIDNTNTTILRSIGQFDGAGNTLILVGEYVDPTTMRPRQIRTVFRIVSKALHIVEVYEIERRGDLKTLEIVYTRR